jgi:hypothetical protein
MNPISYYYINDRLFTYKNEKLIYTLIFNNKITKYPNKTIIDKKRKFIDLSWSNY